MKEIGTATGINDPFAKQNGWNDLEERQQVLNCLPSKVFESEEVNNQGDKLVYVYNLRDTMLPAYLVLEKL